MILLVLLFFGGFVAGQDRPCGYTTVPQSRVIGGEDAIPGAWPWQIALLRYGRFICGGSLISANWVVTAAHCVSGDQDASSYQVVVGDHNRNVNEGTEQKIAARRIFGHPSYNRPSRLNNDIALIQLMSNVSLSNRVNPICLPNNDSDILTGSKCFITGWGKIEHPGSSHHTLQQAMMPPIDQAECRRKIQATGGIVTLTPQMLCAGVKNTILSGCHGDSGGPYVCLNADQKTYTLHGAVSWGSPTCNSSQLYTVFARVTQFLPWIKQHKEHGDGEGGSSPPPPRTPPIPATVATPPLPVTTPAGSTGWSCGFEDSSICNFTQEKSDTFDWRQNKGSTTSSNTGPSSGHGGSGYYMYIETSSPRQYGDYATLVSPVQKFSKIMCLTFYYHMYGSAIGNLTVSIDGQVKFFEAGNQGTQWVEAKINVDVCGDHPVIFTATRGRTYTGDIAIDDISLKQGSCTLGTTPPQFPKVFKCSFDNSTCGLKQSRNDTFDWTQHKGRTLSSSTGPSSDHSSGNGYYMYIEASSPRVQGDYAVLSSPALLSTGNTCITFYYHMYGSGMGNLTVNVNGRVLFRKSGNQGDRWIVAKFDNYIVGMYKVVFIATRGSNFKSDIAIDDVIVRPGSCFSVPVSSTAPPVVTASPAPVSNVIKCSFSTNSSCGFTQSRNDKFDWIRHRGITTSSSTGPSSDHTGGNGYYMYIEASSPRVQGDYAVLSSPALLSTGNTCITFYYHMYGSGMGNLTVNVNGRVLFRKSGNQGDRWIVAKLDNYIVGVYKVVFNATRGSNFQSDIAIDDVIVRPGSCLSGTTPPQLPKVFKCSFDNSACGLKQSRNDTFDWTRHKGRTLSSSTGPSSDHSSGNGYYMYIEASSPRVQGDYAVLSSPALLSTGNTCITFYYHMYGSGMGNLTVNVNGRVLFRKSGNQGDRWIVAKFDNYIVGVYKVVFNATRGSNFQSDIAIDDVIVRPGSCLSVPVSSTAPPVVTASPAPVSNVIKCSFSTNSSCGFTQSRNDKFDWTRHRGITTSSSTGPSSDHTGGNGYYMYIETSSPRKQGDYAELLSPAVRFGGQTCLQFFYHMYGATIGGLLVFVDKKNLFSKIGNQGNKWLDARINISKYGVYKVSFVGVRGSSFTGDIAIDDISLRPGPCLPGPPTVQPCIPPLPASCGLRPHTRIVGGTVATPGSWPWQTMLRSLSGFQFCGGTLVSDEYVITAAHCIGSNPFQIRLGAHKRTTSVTGYEQDFNVSKVITHPLYQFPQRFSHDIAIVKLSKPAQLNRRVHPACLPLVVPAPVNGERCWITGWGRTSAGGPSPDVLLQASVPIVSRPRCDKAYPNQIHDSMICAGLDQGGIDSCQGDSGGPMVCETGGRYYLHGVTSWGHGCALPNKFGVYAKVTYRYLLDWIMSEIAKK
ncbi:MAM and LDL-receptor class A domain-containing protein 1-like isoform X3 [Montipora foliosa]|uniref:MAM and LDL-receptor class A domain-containing protein 1-like isoform X3 n=1 Tax=Montipora foliosa TaxID=591990 RepID=UPI0035F20B0F